MSTLIYEKSDKGREEIATRMYKLSPRLRSLLVMVDGEQTASSLLQRIVGLGMNEQSLQALFDQGFIRVKSGAVDDNNSDNNPVQASMP